MSSQNLPPSLPQNQVAIRGELYRGPLPDPEMLERYKNADPSFPERIVKMAENHNDADVGTKKSISRSNIILPLTGQIFTFLLGIGSLFTCIYLAEKGYTGGAIAAVAVGFAPIIINALRSFKQNSHSREKQV
jgi:uncharacterized membrane protein